MYIYIHINKRNRNEKTLLSKTLLLASAAVQTCWEHLSPRPEPLRCWAATFPRIPRDNSTTLRPNATATSITIHSVRGGIQPNQGDPPRSRIPYLSTPAPWTLPGPQGRMREAGSRPLSAVAPLRGSLAPACTAAAVPRVGRDSDAF